jgi:hypothetical protein
MISSSIWVISPHLQVSAALQSVEWQLWLTVADIHHHKATSEKYTEPSHFPKMFERGIDPGELKRLIICIC